MRILKELSFKAAFRVWQRNATVYRRTWKLNILPNFFEPLLYLLGMGLGLGAYVSEINGQSYLSLIAPGLLMASVMWGASLETTYNVFVKMNFDRIYDGILTTPVGPVDLTFGELLWGATRGCIYGGAFYLVLLVFGFGGVWVSLKIIPALILTGYLFATIGLLFTSLIKEIELFNYFFTLFLTPLFLFSGIFFPLTRLPAVIDKIAWMTPLYHAVEISRALLTPSYGARLGVHVGWMLVVAFINTIVVFHLMRRRLYS